VDQITVLICEMDNICISFGRASCVEVAHVVCTKTHFLVAQLHAGNVSIPRFLNPLTPKLNPSAHRCLTRFVTRDFASLTVPFVNVCVKTPQMQQIFIQFINYVWYLLHVLALYCHPQGEFLVPSERCSIEEQSIEYSGWACCA
jgi:hypothetical protein